MKLALNMNECLWYLQTPVSGSKTGWSEWVLYPRLDALRLIELGWTFEYIH